MEFTIDYKVTLDAPAEPHDVGLQRLHVKLDGVDQPVQEGPLGHVFEVVGKVGQSVEATGGNVSMPSGIEKLGETEKFKIVDNVEPPAPGLPKIVDVSKKFPAAGPAS